MLVCLRPKMRKVLIFVSANWNILRLMFSNCFGAYFLLVTNCKLISNFALQAPHTYIATLYQITYLDLVDS